MKASRNRRKRARSVPILRADAPAPCLHLRCRACDFIEHASADAWQAMGFPSPEALGWLRTSRGWLCEDCR